MFSGHSIANLGAVSLRNAILSAPAGAANCFGTGTFTSADHNLAGDTSCNLTGAADLQGSDPLLGPLADNGGPTPTMALLDNSPALDRSSAGGATTDQRGLARVYDFPGPPNAIGGDGADIGAFERQAVPTPSVPLPANPREPREPREPDERGAGLRVPIAVCQHAVTLLDVVAISRGRVRVTGLARRAYTGRTVTVARGGKTVATAVIAADGRLRRDRRRHLTPSRPATPRSSTTAPARAASGSRAPSP